jgi:hypothetical protein
MRKKEVVDLPYSHPAETARDRWVTARTVAVELGISLGRARHVMSEVGYVEAKNRQPHYFWPAKISRLSAVLAWAASHRGEVERWAAASGRTKEARRRRLEREIRTLRLLASAMARVPDPAPEVCFWLTLLCQHRGSASLKEAALQALIAAGVPSALVYLESEDGAIAPCRTCIDRALAMGVSPLDYIAKKGPCEECGIGDRYYFLSFRFAGIGEFSYLVPYESGRHWLPGPDCLPRGTLTADTSCFAGAFTRAEREAYTAEEIRGNLLKALGRLSAKTAKKG